MKSSGSMSSIRAARTTEPGFSSSLARRGPVSWTCSRPGANTSVNRARNSSGSSATPFTPTSAANRSSAISSPPTSLPERPVQRTAGRQRDYGSAFIPGQLKRKLVCYNRVNGPGRRNIHCETKCVRTGSHRRIRRGRVAEQLRLPERAGRRICVVSVQET